MTAPPRPVLRWHGGKWRLAPWVIEHMPKHRIYVEPFGGAASVLLRKPPAKGMVTFVRADQVRAKANPGHCFIMAGFRPVGFTEKREYLALQLLPKKMPKAEPCRSMQGMLAL